MVQRKNFFLILIPRSLCHDQEKKVFFSFSHYFHYVIVTGKRNLNFITPLLWLCYDHKKKTFFSFHHDFHYANIFLHHLTSTCYTHFVTNLLKKRHFPHKNMCNFKNFLPQEFRWSLRWFNFPYLMLYFTTHLLLRLTTKGDDNRNLFENIENTRRTIHAIKLALSPNNH